MDEVTLARVRAAVERFDPVPQAVRDGAIAAFAWRTVEAELAELAYDSVTDERALATVRGSGGPRLVTFASPDLTVEIEVSEDGGRRRLVGQVVPPAAGTVEVHHAGGTARATADDLGRFQVEAVAAGPVRVSVRGKGQDSRVDTEWLTL